MKLPLVVFGVALVLGTVVLARSTPAAWQPEGVPVCGTHCGDYPSVTYDGRGGAFVVWRFIVPGSGGNDFDIYARHLNSNGDYAPGWTSDDLPVCTAPGVQGGTVVSDGLGGAIVVWDDYRNADPNGTGPDLYALRTLGDGSLAPGWDANGMPVTRAQGIQSIALAEGDGAGGVFVAWEDDRADPNIYLQYLTATGVPAAGFPADGLPICTDPSSQGGPQLVHDEAGGVIVVWGDLRDALVAEHARGPQRARQAIFGRRVDLDEGATAIQYTYPRPAVYGQRVSADGRTLWQANGVRLTLGRYLRNLAPDGQGGIYVSSTAFGFAQGGDSAYYVQRFTSAGEQAPGWPAEGILIRDAPDVAIGLQMIADGSSGVLLEWEDYRDYWTSSPEVYMQRVQADGSLYPAWPANGMRITHNYLFEVTGDGALAADGLGGVYVVWSAAGSLGYSDLVQHVTGTGQVAAGWPADGVPLSSAGEFYGERITADGMGGAIVAWAQPGPGAVRAQRYGPDGPVAVEVSLVSATATAERVVLVWALTGGAGISPRVERRTAGSAWQLIGEALADGPERARYQDREIASGARYAYRLSWEEAGAIRFSAETWVEVPAALDLALEGLRPNPAVGELNVAFMLPNASPARLELLDVGGRRLLEHDVSGLGVGRHLLQLGRRGEIAPGIYWLRLTQSGDSRLVRAIVVR